MTVGRGVWSLISLHSITTFCGRPARGQFQTRAVIIYLAGKFLDKLAGNVTFQLSFLDFQHPAFMPMQL